MSELIQNNENRDFRWNLLASASALALLGYAATISAATAEDGDRPTVWIELGGQLSRLESGQEQYAPPFVASIPPDLAIPHLGERPARYGFDESAALSIQPQGSDWTFSASLRYGRSGNSKHTHQQSAPANFLYTRTHHSRWYGIYYHYSAHGSKTPIAARFSDAVAKQSESHMVLDFQAGKDVGLGLFGRHASSTLNVGVRFAQFTSKSRFNLRADPDWQFKPHSTIFSSPAYYFHGYLFSNYNKIAGAYQPFHVFSGSFLASRSFSGLGPSVSWNSSEPVAGNSDSGELLFDWGVNAALLFGRQKTQTHHQTTGRFHSSYATAGSLPVTYQRPATPDHARARSVIVPNIGAFAGLSVKYPNLKVSFGYKADFFFGAMDGGIDVRRAEDVSFHGPFASISIGLP